MIKKQKARQKLDRFDQAFLRFIVGIDPYDPTPALMASVRGRMPIPARYNNIVIQ